MTGPKTGGRSITEPTLSTVSLIQQNGNSAHELWSPQPTFVVRVRPPKMFLLLSLLLFGLGLLFLEPHASGF